MANSRREVDLIIRAKDDAAKAVTTITDAINSLVKSQEGLIKSTTTTDKGFASLGAALGTLAKTLRGQSGIDKLGKDLERADKAMLALQEYTKRAEA